MDWLMQNFLPKLKLRNPRKRKMSVLNILTTSLSILLVTFVQLTEQLRFSAVQIPSLVQRNTNFWLACQYQLDHSKQDQLYSVKWYKNNEEFYRLLLAPSDQMAAQDEISNLNQQQQQQHYFAQAGVNVMMSSSNATHVRLLNASLESEGLYACEISTQNLSTIRYEREIRVYVLPQTRLNIIGFRNGYALGDKVDLICSSDFSRPKPAIAWFINGQRIGGKLNRWFEQELETRSKLHEPSLFKLNLRLKFKFSQEFLMAFTLQNQRKKQATQPPPLTNRTNLADQSQTTSRQQQLVQPALEHLQLASTMPQQQLLQRLELQCRYKLTEVSDVTYNELMLTRQQGSSASGKEAASLPVGPASRAGMGRHSATTTTTTTIEPTSDKEDDGEDGEEADERKPAVSEWRPRSSRLMVVAGANEHQRERSRGGGGFVVRINKSPDGNKVTQNKSPANGRELWRAIQLQSKPLGPEQQSCRLGSLVLLPGDPMIIDPMKTGRKSRNQLPASGTGSTVSGQDGGQAGELEMIRVNCSTASALGSTMMMMMMMMMGGNGAAPPTRVDHHQPWRSQDEDEEEKEEDRENNQANKSNIPANLERNEPASSGYCGDQEAQRRSQVSGKSLIVNEPSNQRPKGRASYTTAGNKLQAGHQLVAYLSLQAQYSNNGASLTQNNTIGGDNPNNNEEIGEHQSPLQQQYHQFASMMTTTTAAAAAATTTVTTTVAALANADSSDSSEGSSKIPLAPPLLEWFINNQEAPRASASYSPELPLLSKQASGIGGEFRPAAEQPTMAARGAATATSINEEEPAAETGAEVLPPIDYADYFANFDSRPQKQHLMLNLKPDKKHFLTTDSKLRLRCSSTQAQVLASDLTTLTIVPLLSATGMAGKGHGAGGWQPRSRLPKQKGAHQARASRVSSSAGAVSAGTRPSNCGAQVQSNPMPSINSPISLLTTLALVWMTLCLLN